MFPEKQDAQLLDKLNRYKSNKERRVSSSYIVTMSVKFFFFFNFFNFRV